jgi:two-component system LytT family sensor kinase
MYCQLIGWSLLLPLLIALNFLATTRFSSIAVCISLITCLAGLLTTHLLRNYIRRHPFLTLPIRPILPKLLLLTVTAALIAGLLRIVGLSLWANILTLPPWFNYRNILGSMSEYIFLFIPWTTLYCLYFYIQRRQKEAIEKKRLELLLKEKERSAAGPVVDIDFIISSLDRIRYLIDEDPRRARAGITAFSQLLRKGHLKTQ